MKPSATVIDRSVLPLIALPATSPRKRGEGRLQRRFRQSRRCRL